MTKSQKQQVLICSFFSFITFICVLFSKCWKKCSIEIISYSNIGRQYSYLVLHLFSFVVVATTSNRSYSLWNRKILNYVRTRTHIHTHNNTICLASLTGAYFHIGYILYVCVYMMYLVYFEIYYLYFDWNPYSQKEFVSIISTNVNIFAIK